jgi:hypothetical protein
MYPSYRVPYTNSTGGWTRNRLDAAEKRKKSCTSQESTSSPYPSHYTDWATSVPECVVQRCSSIRYSLLRSCGTYRRIEGMCNAENLTFADIYLGSTYYWRFYQQTDMAQQTRRLKSSVNSNVLLIWSKKGDRGSTVVKVLCYKSEGRWFDSRWCHWNFSLT